MEPELTPDKYLAPGKKVLLNKASKCQTEATNVESGSRAAEQQAEGPQTPEADEGSTSGLNDLKDDQAELEAIAGEHPDDFYLQKNLKLALEGVKPSYPLSGERHFFSKRRKELANKNISKADKEKIVKEGWKNCEDRKAYREIYDLHYAFFQKLIKFWKNKRVEADSLSLQNSQQGKDCRATRRAPTRSTPVGTRQQKQLGKRAQPEPDQPSKAPDLPTQKIRAEPKSSKGKPRKGWKKNHTEAKDQFQVGHPNKPTIQNSQDQTKTSLSNSSTMEAPKTNPPSEPAPAQKVPSLYPGEEPLKKRLVPQPFEIKSSPQNSAPFRVPPQGIGGNNQRKVGLLQPANPTLFQAPQPSSQYGIYQFRPPVAMALPIRQQFPVPKPVFQSMGPPRQLQPNSTIVETRLTPQAPTALEAMGSYYKMLDPNAPCQQLTQLPFVRPKPSRFKPY